MTNKLSDKKNNNKDLWKIKKRTQMKHSSAFAVRDKDGNDIIRPEEIKKRVTEYYDNLFENNKVIEGYEEYQKDQEEFIKQCWSKRTEPNYELK